MMHVKGGVLYYCSTHQVQVRNAVILYYSRSTKLGTELMPEPIPLCININNYLGVWHCDATLIGASIIDC